LKRPFSSRKQPKSTRNEQNELESLIDTQPDEVAAAKKVLALEIQNQSAGRQQFKLTNTVNA
jgi:hypothetical protein